MFAVCTSDTKLLLIVLCAGPARSGVLPEATGIVLRISGAREEVPRTEVPGGSGITMNRPLHARESLGPRPLDDLRRQQVEPLARGSVQLEDVDLLASRDAFDVESRNDAVVGKARNVRAISTQDPHSQKLR